MQYDLMKLRPSRAENLIRLGRDNDGGYVVAKEQTLKTEILLSFGINDDWSFESDFEKQKKIKIFAYDYSVSEKVFSEKIRNSIGYMVGSIFILHRSEVKEQIKIIKNLKAQNSRIQNFFNNKYDKYLFPKFLGDVDNDEYITFDNVFKNLSDAPPLSIFIKMDIEGYEYKTLPYLKKYFNKINGMVIEFHDLYKDENLKSFEKITRELFVDFEIIHIHGNNNGGQIINTLLPVALEITFMHKKVFKNKIVKSELKYPVDGLDMPCNKDFDDIILFE